MMFDVDDVSVNTVQQWLKHAGPNFHNVGIQDLVLKWHKAIERYRDYMDNVPK